MNNKYYTPYINEFNPEFRFEAVSAKAWQDGPTYDKDKGWYLTDIKFLGFNLDKIEKAIKNNSVRVKFLDQQDIEELGWVYKGKHWFNHQDEYYEINVDEYSSFYLHKYTDSDIGRGGYTILEASPGGYSLSMDVYKFDGEIRNYNELKFIMARAGINRDR